RIIISLILIILLLYSGYWLVVSNILKKTISNELNKNDYINFKDLSISGFPTQIQTNIHKFKILDSMSSNEILESDLIKVSMHPFDSSKIALKSDITNILINNDALTLNVALDKSLSLLSIDNSGYININLAIEDIIVLGNEINIASLEQIHIKLNETSFKNFKINSKINFARLETLESQDVSIKIDGNLKLNNNAFDGNLNLSVKELKLNEEIFNIPLTIKKNQVIFLFMNIFDLNRILSFL
ncbi:MAG: hypothetical protein CMI87_04590, partial [Pelagibacteraceae bacterium]|nr:hypothetical protein [Pelagibacteraceae bacterium]